MLDINVKIAIVVGFSFNLYFFDNDIQKAVLNWKYFIRTGQ